MKFPFYRQLDSNDSGFCCIRMLAKHFGTNIPSNELTAKAQIESLYTLVELGGSFNELGFNHIIAKTSLEELKKSLPLPCVIHWDQKRFVVLYKIKKGKYYIADPTIGLVKYSEQEFTSGWGTINNISSCLIIKPVIVVPQNENKDKAFKSFGFLWQYIKVYKKYFFQLFLNVLVISIIQLILPFLTQSIVDIGINIRDYNFIVLIVVGQLVLFLAKTSAHYIRLWILMHINTRISISIISDFLNKIMRLPLGFFDNKNIGDILQRINDHSRIEQFLASNTLDTIFSMISFFVLILVLAVYNLNVFFVFLIGSTLYILWILLFLKKRRSIDYTLFNHYSSNQSKLIQIIYGIKEIKLSGRENQKRWEWEGVQTKIFKANLKRLSLYQVQHFGGDFINEVKNVLITGIVAFAVIDGHMTLGMMLATQLIVGQLNSPLEEFILLLNSAQDAKLSLERLGEIHLKKNEDDDFGSFVNDNTIPTSKEIVISNLSFKYQAGDIYALNNINLIIPENKTTAIVGSSGSGKTTLIKLLLGFYKVSEGLITIGNTPIDNFNMGWWRTQCGAVMQDGYIFSESVERNIAGSDEVVDKVKLKQAVELANIKEFIENLPMGYKTLIGDEGQQVSQGQQQRLLIARVIYKNPTFLFFDEATNALDANNERIIMNNLNNYFQGKTVIIIAHRLSTVKNADQIIVLDNGNIVEVGNHTNLTQKRGAYYNLVKNQLELGS